VASVVLLTLLPWNTAEAQTFKNCAAVKAKYPNGVAINRQAVGTSAASVSRQIYLLNKRLDRDVDGIVCEDESLQAIGTSGFSLDRQKPVDLAVFSASYSPMLATIRCQSGRGISLGTGTSVDSGRSGEMINENIRSLLVTNHHVVADCLSGGWLSRQVSVTSMFATCTGYVWNWNVEKDLALVVTTCDVPKVSSIRSGQVPRPRVGDAVVVIGSAVGAAGTSTQGAIANVTAEAILTTAQAAPGSSGGALFNRDGQLLGVVQGGVGSLTLVVPITRFTGVTTSLEVAWGP